MNEPNQADEISRELDAIFANFFGPPTELDLRGVDPATFAVGLTYGFDTWQDVRVVANNRRHVAVATRYWDEDHPSPDFLRHTIGTDERAAGHRLLLDRAHPDCADCAATLAALARASVADPDRVDPNAPLDDLDIEIWAEFQSMEVARGTAEADVAGVLHVPGREADHRIRAEHVAGRRWRITVRDPEARQATVWIRWTDGGITTYSELFHNDLAEVDAEAPSDGARPERVRIQVTDPPPSA
jgi:hypothetical protein